ncbi:hypothetical protein ZEAMMB73_Zm00001d035560 [Zea mays]|jgi:hypothetical protein|uniref:Uncharacterized protein n=1 Tax=Zea mays TaxID=4577 RepID=A0A1D6LH92_MAIZE|nr:hypothetical protein ZEAMMB73_Zm00001d035560 [Zea mays]
MGWTWRQPSNGEQSSKSLRPYLPLIHAACISSSCTCVQIDLGDAEVVREVSGTYGMFEGATTLTSIRILTSSRTWGPWGIEDGTRFCITAPIGSSIVGFYGRSTSRLVAAIGVYLRQQL